ncbi:hypothetical protein PMG11_04216 [Penicillium brasilianum]|uniref:Uncharacterized protein n=1 Tax=Penicillium brasilianum TaxID=104259 RepID=A0A0F7VIV9_PENBI|nr:hypothetical protein PMG11_04216 [Penicillium brasilianum]
MVRYLPLFLFLTLFSHNILAAVVPKSDGNYDESLSEALDSDAISGYEQESGEALVSDIDNDEGDFNIHAIRAPADCNNLIRSGIDSCKKAVQSGIATCKKKIVDDVAACHIQVRQDIDNCKKKAKDPFTKARCELNRKPRDVQCEARRSKIPTCEKNRPKVLACCEGLRTRVQGLCAVKVVPTEAVRNGLKLGQDICIRGLI